MSETTSKTSDTDFLFSLEFKNMCVREEVVTEAAGI